MQIKKLMIYFVILITIGIFTHVLIQFLRSSSIPDLTRTTDFYDERFSNMKKFTGLFNAMQISCHRNISMVILVLSQTKDRLSRDSIRQTWAQWISGKYSQYLPPNILKINYHSYEIKLIFVLGSQSTEIKNISEELKYLKDESHFDDIMYFPGLKDSYMNLTLKTLTSLHTARRFCPFSTYFLKADTDVFINIPFLIDYYKANFDQSQKVPLIFGNQQIGAPVIRDVNSKWYVPTNQYKENYFPNYVTGCGYILNKLAVDNVIKKASTFEDLFAWEDVAVTGLYSENVTIVDTKLFRYENFMNTVDSCYMKIIILAHRIYPPKMTSLWNDIMTNRTFCSSSATQLFQTMVQFLIGN